MTSTSEAAGVCQTVTGLSWIQGMFCLLLLLPSCNSKPPPLQPRQDRPAATQCVNPDLIHNPDWERTQRQLRSIITKARESTVVVLPSDRKRGGSGCIITPDGLILTAAHVVNLLKPGETNFTIVFHDGKEAQAVPLGANVTSDLALLKIVEPTVAVLPTTAISNGSPGVAAPVCFLGYPGKHSSGANVHARFGFVTYRRTSSVDPAKPVMMVSDIPIQPGDSGGPLLSMDGRLVGIASSAGGPLNYNRYVPIEHYHSDLSRLKKGDRWGDINKGPTRSKLSYRVDTTGVDRLRLEFDRRESSRCPDAVALAERTRTAGGIHGPKAQELVDLLGPDIEPVTLARPFSRGKSSPQFSRTIDAMVSAPTATVIELTLEDTRIGYAVAVEADMVVAKKSLWQKEVKGRSGDNVFKLKMLSSDEHLDLALLKVDGPLMVPCNWTPETSSPGSLVVAYGALGRNLGWGIISGEPHDETGTDNKTGPLPVNSTVSDHRGPYENVVAHDILVSANDMGSLVLDLQGHVIGFNVARKNRTQTIMITAKDMVDAVQAMMVPTAE